jgi:hypothetical protein
MLPTSLNTGMMTETEDGSCSEEELVAFFITPSAELLLLLLLP